MDISTAATLEALGAIRLLFSHESRWLEAASAPHTGLTLMPLRRGDKRPIWKKKMFVLIALMRTQDGKDPSNGCLAKAYEWLLKGWNLGINLYRSHYWVLDIDGCDNLPPTVEALLSRDDIPRVNTPSGGVHLYFRLPNELRPSPRATGRMKAHVNHPVIDGIKLPLDVKLGGGYTYVAAPGSSNSKGRYKPVSEWSDPPILDPRVVIPGLQIFHQPTEGGARRRWDKDTRPKDDRLQAAYAQIRKTPVSVAGQGGRATLFRLVCHLRKYLDLDPQHVHHILCNPRGKSWNDRCSDGVTGQPYPWSELELTQMIESCEGSIPLAGIQRRKERVRGEWRDKRLGQAMVLLKGLTETPGDLVPVAEVREIVREVIHLSPKECTGKRFGDLLRRHGIQVVFKGHLNERCIKLSITNVGLIRHFLIANLRPIRSHAADPQ